MRHRVHGRRLNRTSAHRKAMRRNMAISLFQHGAIRTTEQKAKDLRSFVEKIITMARKGTVHARRLISADLGNRRGVRGLLYDNDENEMDKGVLDMIFDDIAPRYASRPGGYTRIIHLAERRLGDAGRQVVLQLVEDSPTSRNAKASSSRRKRAGRRIAAAEAVAVEAPSTAPVEAAADEGEAAEGDAE